MSYTSCAYLTYFIKTNYYGKNCDGRHKMAGQRESGKKCCRERGDRIVEKMARSSWTQQTEWGQDCREDGHAHPGHSRPSTQSTV